MGYLRRANTRMARAMRARNPGNGVFWVVGGGEIVVKRAVQVVQTVTESEFVAVRVTVPWSLKAKGYTFA
jgi:hypothetical protein